MRLEGARCPICSEGHLARHKGELTLHYKGGTIRFMNHVSYRCSGCAEEFSAPAENKDNDKAFIDFCREVDGLLKPAEIKALRKDLALSQAELARLLDVGEKTFARYETGRVAQGRAMDTLLRILRDVPQAREQVLRGNPGAPRKNVILVTSAQAMPEPSFPLFDMTGQTHRICSCTIGG